MQLANVSSPSYGDFVQGVKFNIACYKIFKIKKNHFELHILAKIIISTHNLKNLANKYTLDVHDF